MGIRESLLNTITSVGNSDFVRIVTSAGASSKATVANLFKSFESGLSAKSSLGTSDYIRVVGSDNNSYKQSLSAVKTALGVDELGAKIDALNTKTASYTPTFTWSDGTTPTVANISFSYTKMGKLLWLSGRFQITDKGPVGNSATLQISLPSGITGRSLTPSTVGTVVPSTISEPPLFVVRTASTTIYISWGASGGYSSTRITAQYYTIFAVVPIE